MLYNQHVGDVLVNELERNLGRFACIKDVEDILYTSNGDENNGAEEGFEELESCMPQLSRKCHDNSFSEDL